MTDRYMDALSIRYAKLKFMLRMTEDCMLPAYKASAIRGTIGEMLLRANCIGNRECSKCAFVRECIVQRTMYSQFDNKPSYVTTGESVGYVIQCEDYKEAYKAGDNLSFNLILFGKTIVYFNQYLQAVFAMGRNGFGKDNAHFEIEQVLNIYGAPILNRYNVMMENYKYLMLSDYVNHRLKKLGISDDADVFEQVTLVFKTPLTTKFNSEELREFIPPAVVGAVARRLETLDAFEGIDGELWKQLSYEYRNSEDIEYTEDSEYVSIRRYSFRKKQEMYLRGIKGELTIYNVPRDIMIMLIAGELTHAGKNSSFGFGRYIVVPNE